MALAVDFRLPVNPSDGAGDTALLFADGDVQDCGAPRHVADDHFLPPHARIQRRLRRRVGVDLRYLRAGGGHLFGPGRARYVGEVVLG